MKTHGIDLQKDGVTITKLSTDGTISSSDDETLLTSQAIKTYADNTGFASKAHAFRDGTAQTIPSGSFTKVEWDVKEYDGLNEFDIVTNHRFTATDAGYYMVVGII